MAEPLIVGCVCMHYNFNLINLSVNSLHNDNPISYTAKQITHTAVPEILLTVPHLSRWQLREQTWAPHSSVQPQVSPQVGISCVQGSIYEVFPHGQERAFVNGHGPHEPKWQTLSHLWLPQLRSSPHFCDNRQMLISLIFMLH